MARGYSLAELARATGVGAATIRRYGRAGLLPVRRRYSDADRLKLLAVDQLAALGATPRVLRAAFARRLATPQLLAIYLAGLELARARTTRAAAAVTAALSGDRTAGPVLSRRLDALTRAAALDLADHVRAIGTPGLDTSPVAAALRDLPVDLSDAQWEALIEVVDLLPTLPQGSSHGFAAVAETFERASWRQLLDDLIAQAHGAWVRHDPPASRRGRVLATRWVNHAASLARVSMHEAATDLLERAERQDPKIERVWELIAIIRGWSGPPPHIVAFRWLIEAVRAHHAQFRR